MAINDFTFFGSAIAYEKLTVSNSVKTLSKALFEHIDEAAAGASNAIVDARLAYITVEATNGMRYTLDGTDPVGATTGHLCAGGASLVITGHVNIEKFKAIRDSGADAVIHVTYFA